MPILEYDFFLYIDLLVSQNKILLYTECPFNIKPMAAETLTFTETRAWLMHKLYGELDQFESKGGL